MTACVITNTALELLEGPCEDVIGRALPHFRNDLSYLFWCLYHILQGIDFKLLFAPMPMYEDAGPGREAIYDHLLIPNWQIIGGLEEILADSEILAYRPGHHGTYDSNTKFDKADFNERWYHCQVLLCESFMEYQKIIMFGDIHKGQQGSRSPKARTDDNYFRFDQMACAVGRFLESKKTSLYLLVVSQVFLDIHMALGNDAKNGLAELRRNAKNMHDSLAERKRMERGIKLPTWSTEDEKSLDVSTEELKFWTSFDPIEVAWKDAISRLERPDISMFTMVRQPFACGLLLFRLRLQFQNVGLNLANAWGTILLTAHLFEACRHSGTVEGYQASLIGSSTITQRAAVPMPPWPDMDLVIDMHGEKEMFGGKVPTDITESNVAFLKIRGYSLDSQRATRHVVNNTELPQHLRRTLRSDDIWDGPYYILNDRTQIQPLFSVKYLGPPHPSGNHTKMDIGVIEKLLADIRASEQRDKNKKAKTKTKGSSFYKLRRARKHQTQKISIVQLLSVLEAGLLKETPSLRFDYVSMHCRCFKLLKAVKTASDSYFTRKLGAGYIESDHQIIYIVGWILRWANFSTVGVAAQGLVPPRIGRRGTGIFSKVLIQAAGVVKEKLADVGEQEAETRKVAALMPEAKAEA